MAVRDDGTLVLRMRKADDDAGAFGVTLMDVGSEGGRLVRIFTMRSNGLLPKAGARVGDFILSVNGIEVRDEEHASRLLRQVTPGKDATIVLRRAWPKNESRGQSAPHADESPQQAPKVRVLYTPMPPLEQAARASQQAEPGESPLQQPTQSPEPQTPAQAPESELPPQSSPAQPRAEQAETTTDGPDTERDGSARCGCGTLFTSLCGSSGRRRGAAVQGCERARAAAPASAVVKKSRKDVERVADATDVQIDVEVRRV